MRGQAKLVLAAIVLASPALPQKSNASRGEQDFRVCAPCHSLEPDRNMTGPSLAGLLGSQGRELAELRPLLRSAQIIRDHLRGSFAGPLVD